MAGPEPCWEGGRRVARGRGRDRRRVHPEIPGGRAGLRGAGDGGAGRGGADPVAPDTAEFLVAYLALAGLGLRVPLRKEPSLACGLVVVVALNVAYLLASPVSVPGFASLSIGAAFVFAVGVFMWSAQIAQDQAQAAQLRAEDLLAQPRASQAARAEVAALTERARLAREIHDVLAHASLIKHGLEHIWSSSVCSSSSTGYPSDQMKLPG
jgi:hypothetical protein